MPALLCTGGRLGEPSLVRLWAHMNSRVKVPVKKQNAFQLVAEGNYAAIGTIKTGFAESPDWSSLRHHALAATPGCLGDAANGRDPPQPGLEGGLHGSRVSKTTGPEKNHPSQKNRAFPHSR